jgi:hypothetical protein
MYVYQIQPVKHGVTLLYPEYKSSSFLLDIALSQNIAVHVTQG